MKINTKLFYSLITCSILFSACEPKESPIIEDPIPETVDTVFYESGKYGGFPLGSHWTYHYQYFIQDPMTGQVFTDVNENQDWLAEQDTLIGETLYQKFGPKLIRVQAESYYELLTNVDGSTQEWKYMDGDLESGEWTTDTLSTKVVQNDTIKRFDHFEIVQKYLVYDFNGTYLTEVVELKHTEFGIYGHGSALVPVVYTERYAKNIGMIERIQDAGNGTVESMRLLDYEILE